MRLNTADNMVRRLDAQAVVELDLNPEIISLAGKIQDHAQASEFAEEEDTLGRAVPKRRAEFRAGRNLARIALQCLGVDASALPRNEDRSPLWPHGVCGSISHTDDWVMVSVTAASDLCGLGIDGEIVGSVQPDLRAIIHAEERESTIDDTLLFSAKEAVYKAVYPLCREFLEFSDVTIKLSDRYGEFIATCRPGFNSTPLVAQGIGRILRLEDLVITGFWIPTSGFKTYHETTGEF